MKNIDIMDEDLKYIFHPCTQMKDHEKLPLIPIKEAKGVYLYDFNGNKYIDAISSWWVNIFGHRNKYINKSIINQLDKLEHVIFAGFTHSGAISLAKRLVKITPAGLNKVFFADNGSSGVEVALKMAFHYFKNKNQIKPYFISLENSYHGETIGALSVSDMGLYKDVYDEILIKSIQTIAPRDKSKKEAKRAINYLKDLIKKYKDKISALILEPLVQCAGNMNMYHKYYLKEVRKITKENNILLIADEVAVGFGRTGYLFGVNSANITPDLMVLSKGLSGGYLPLSVVMLTDEIYSAFYCDYDGKKNFLHSHSYTGNALACSAALASLDIFKKEDIINKNKSKIKYLKKLLKKFKKLNNVVNIRQTGFIGALDIVSNNPRIGLEVYKYGLKKGVLLRPLGKTIYFMPPYIITKKELKKVIDVAYKGIKRLG